jgi:hypothetical protein
MTAPLRCTKCREFLPLRQYRAGVSMACGACASETEFWVFPAFLKRHEAASADLIVDDSEASCFYHASKRAAVACEACGRFICSLCEVELKGVRLCPPCMESGRQKGSLGLESSRPLYGNIALGLAVLPILTVWLTLFGAPAALYVVSRYWTAPGSLVHPGRKKLVIAGIIAILQIFCWLGLFIAIAFNLT